MFCDIVCLGEHICRSTQTYEEKDASQTVFLDHGKHPRKVRQVARLHCLI